MRPERHGGPSRASKRIRSGAWAWRKKSHEHDAEPSACKADSASEVALLEEHATRIPPAFFGVRVGGIDLDHLVEEEERALVVLRFQLFFPLGEQLLDVLLHRV